MKRVQSVERAIDILAALGSGSRTLTEITRVTGLSKGTAFRLLASLNHRQFVIRDPVEGGYLLGPAFLGLFESVLGDLGAIAKVAMPILQRLSGESGETVTLHVRSAGERICVAESPSSQAIRYTASVGATAPLHVGSAGKVLLAAMSEDKRAQALASQQLTPVTAATITDRSALEEEVATVARQGWAISSGERIDGAGAVSVPVRSRSGLNLALSILGPADRLSVERRLALVPNLQQGAKEIEAAFDALDLSDEGEAASEDEGAVSA